MPRDTFLRSIRLAGLAGSLALGGCVATQRDVLDVESQMDGLQVEIVKLRQTLEGVQKNQADLVVRMDTLHGDLSQFSENLSSYRDQVSSLGTRLDDLDASLGKKIAALQISTTPIMSPMTPSQLFYEAQGHLDRKEYTLAVEGFKLYLQQSPNGNLADRAYYYTGEANFGAGKSTEAAKSYAQVLDKFPKSDLTAAARLRYAMALIKIGPQKVPEAERYLESIGADFPDSPEAEQADKTLQELHPPKTKAKKTKKRRKTTDEDSP